MNNGYRELRMYLFIHNQRHLASHHCLFSVLFTSLMALISRFTFGLDIALDLAVGIFLYDLLLGLSYQYTGETTLSGAFT